MAKPAQDLVLAVRRPWFEAALWLAFLGPCFFLVYGGCNWITAQRPDVGVFYFAWERWIPFVPVMIVPYMSIDLLFAVAPFLCRHRRELHTLAARVLFAIALSAIGFLLFPLRLGWERPEVAGWLGAWFAPLNALDQPFNLAPSLHISLRSILWVVYSSHTNGLLRRFLQVWFVLVGLSTVLIYQHHVIDVLSGYGVAVLALSLFRDANLPPHPENTGSSQGAGRIALKYLLGSLALAVIGLAPWPGNWIVIWPAVALLLLAGAYGGLGVRVFAKAGGRLPLRTRVLLGPYLAGMWLTHRLGVRREPAWAAISDGVLLGRRLTRREAGQLLECGVTAVLDLTVEYAAVPALRHLAYRSLPVLDLTPPTVAQLNEAVSFIRAERSRGKVYVHCALGLGRSAAVGAAWLLAEGIAGNVDEALRRIREQRPGMVVSAECRAVLGRFRAASDEPQPPHPVPLPIGWGEGARRAGEGVAQDGFMVGEQVRKEEEASHEPQGRAGCPHPAATLDHGGAVGTPRPTASVPVHGPDSHPGSGGGA